MKSADLEPVLRKQRDRRMEVAGAQELALEDDSRRCHAVKLREQHPDGSSRDAPLSEDADDALSENAPEDNLLE